MTDECSATLITQSIPYIAGWGEDGALEADTAFAKTIDQLTRQLEDALAETVDERTPAAIL
jgi:hypothetical protein